jgi:RNA polymerase sigma factor (sigma-70 family)
MLFPPTHQTLIQRLAAGGSSDDWQEFLTDYWGPVCRFAQRKGGLSCADAEDVAAETFKALVQNQLLVGWFAHRTARLRTLLCTVVLNQVTNRARVQAGRVRLLREHGDRLEDHPGLPLLPDLDAPAEEVDAIHAAWVEDLLYRTIEALRGEYHQAGKDDYFRVLYGKLCEDMTTAEVAQSLCWTISQVENAYKHVRKHLEERVRDCVDRYSPAEEAEGEFAAEWAQLGAYLKEHGGLEEAVRRAWGAGQPLEAQPGQDRSPKRTLSRLSEFFRRGDLLAGK